jgi:hypothetical protein
VNRTPIITSTVTVSNGVSDISNEVRYYLDPSDVAKNREIATTLKMTPSILPDNTIRLQIDGTVSTIVGETPVPTSFGGERNSQQFSDRQRSAAALTIMQRISTTRCRPDNTRTKAATRLNPESGLPQEHPRILRISELKPTGSLVYLSEQIDGNTSKEQHEDECADDGGCREALFRRCVVRSH